MLLSTQQAPCLPKVRFHSAVARIKELGHGTEVVIFLVVHLLVHTSGRCLHAWVLEHRRDIGGSQHTSHQGQVHARRKKRVHEAGGITHEDVAVTHHFVGDVGPVSYDKGTIDELCLAEHLRCAWCLRHLV